MRIKEKTSSGKKPKTKKKKKNEKGKDKRKSFFFLAFLFLFAHFFSSRVQLLMEYNDSKYTINIDPDDSSDSGKLKAQFLLPAFFPAVAWDR